MVVHAPRRSRRRHPRRCGVGYAACRVRSPVPAIRQTASGEFNTPTAKGVKPTGPPFQQTPSGEFDLAGVESICQTRSGESGSMEPGGRFWRIWNAPPPRVRSPTVIVSVLADLPRLREERMENGNISRASPAGGDRAAARHPAARHLPSRSWSARAALPCRSHAGATGRSGGWPRIGHCFRDFHASLANLSKTYFTYFTLIAVRMAMKRSVPSDMARASTCRGASFSDHCSKQMSIASDWNGP